MKEEEKPPEELNQNLLSTSLDTGDKKKKKKYFKSNEYNKRVNKTFGKDLFISLSSLKNNKISSKGHTKSNHTRKGFYNKSNKNSISKLGRYSLFKSNSPIKDRKSSKNSYMSLKRKEMVKATSLKEFLKKAKNIIK